MEWRDWMRTVEVEPSLYAADFSRLGEQIDILMRAGVRIFHFDVGDGHFIEPITIGPIVLQSISDQIHRQGGVIDCHLMTETPAKHFEAIAAAGGDSVTVHIEACDDLHGEAIEHGRQPPGRADGEDLRGCCSAHLETLSATGRLTARPGARTGPSTRANASRCGRTNR